MSERPDLDAMEEKADGGWWGQRDMTALLAYARALEAERDALPGR